jgi:acylglycerol lipase
VSTLHEGITRVEGLVESDDGLRLFWRGWCPAAPRAALLLVHGLAEHSGRYEHVAAHFAERGYASYAVDCRGHGMSPGPRVHVPHFDLYVGDVRALHRLAAARHPGAPIFLVGHSQGGLVALHYAYAHPAGLRGLVLSSPFLDVHPDTAPPRAKRMGARLLARVSPGVLLPNALNVSCLSRDPAVGEAYARDPLVSRKVSPGWFRAVRQAQREVTARAPLLPLPALIMAAGGDRLVDPQVVRRWAEQAPPERTEFVWWEGLYHELFNETVKDEVFARMEAWLERRMSGVAT